MKHTSRRIGLILAAAVFATSTCMAAPAPKKPKVVGLDGLDDQAVAAELSSRGLGNLLDHYFKVNNVPEPQQAAIKTFGALGDLKSPTLTPGEKMQRVKAVVDGIDTVLPALKDPKQMADTAAIILEYGVNQKVNNLEYFGEDPVTQAQLKPMAEAMYKLFVKAGKAAREQADQLGNLLHGDKDPRAAKWQAMDDLANSAGYTTAMTAYFRCLGRPAGDPERKKIAEAGIVALADYDTPDSQVQARVRNMIAKLQMVSGQYKLAKKTFEGVITPVTPPDITPPPNPYEVFEARYFLVSNDLMAKDLPSAEADKKSLDIYAATGLPDALKKIQGISAAQIEANAKSNEAALELLQWRVLLLQSEKAAPAARGKIDEAAEAVLLKLREAHPELRFIIDEQLVKRMDPKKPIDDKMATSILLALIKKAKVETYKPAGEKVDDAVLAKGIEAAKVLVTRKGQPGVTPGNLEDAALTVAVLLEKQGKKVAAAEAYIDYAVDFHTVEPAKAAEALNYAGYQVFSMKKEASPPEGFEKLYDKFVPIAILPPFNNTDLAYSYAVRLLGVNKFAEAIKFFRLVPKGNAAYALAQYKMMIAYSSMLSETKLTADERKDVVKNLLDVADVVRAAGVNATDLPARGKAAHAATIIARIARTESHEPQRALTALDGMEELAKGQPPETEAALVHEAMNERVNAYMALNPPQFDKAVTILTTMLEGAKGDDGIILVRNLLDKLDHEFSTAQIAHDQASMRVTASNQAKLTGYLANWCNPTTQKNPAIAKLYYAYKVYDARTQRIAGSLADDPAERKQLLQAAQAQYNKLLAPDMHALYIAQPTVKAQIKDGRVAAEDQDPAVATGLALTDFDLGNYQSAKDHLEPMLADKGFGTPMVKQVDPSDPGGGLKLMPNDLYWEAWYKFLKSDYEISKAVPADRDKVGRILKNVLLEGTVPERYAEGFEQLRKDLIPTFNASNIATPTTAPAAPAAVVAPASAASAK